MSKRGGKGKGKLDMVYVLDVDGAEFKVSRRDAEDLVKHGHARWKRTSIIEMLRNVPKGPGLSLRVGAEIATAAAEFREKGDSVLWAQVAVQEILGRRRIGA